MFLPLLALVLCLSVRTTYTDNENLAQLPYSQESFLSNNNSFLITEPKIHEIIISGNRNVPTQAISAKIPYRTGQHFKPNKTSEIIRALNAMGYFKPLSIQVAVEELSPSEINLHINVEEKELIEEVVFEGNAHLKRDEIDKKTGLPELRGIDSADMERIAHQIKELYMAKDYHNVAIKTELVPLPDNKVQAKFIIDEGCVSIVKQVIFKGNYYIPSKKLRSLIFTREDWLLGFINKAGSYQPDAIEYDKYVIEHYYKSNGFLHAKVTDVTVTKDCDNPYNYIVTFTICEGGQYCINKVSAIGNELMTEAEILATINIRPGQLYSSEQIRQTIEMLRLVWGEYGYIFAENNVGVEPDEIKKTVDLTFSTTLGNPISCNRITITGNAKTQENVIRREITVNEGELITTRAMDVSKERVERLGYFDPKNGVNWKTTRLNDTQADLDLLLKEVKTGKLYMDLKVGGDATDFQSPAQSLQIGLGARDINFRGTGIQYSAAGYFSRQDRQIGLNVVNPWLFNKPLRLEFDIFHRSSTYQDFKNVVQPPREQITGMSGSFGFSTTHLGGMTWQLGLGFESISYKDRIIASLPPARQVLQEEFQELINIRFQPGNVFWTDLRVFQDCRNNPITPSKGYLWTSTLKIGIPHETDGFGFIKWDADAHWYTPLINEFDLIFHLHGHLGIINQISNFQIPYRELYHIGGPATVRGFLFGQIGPTFLNNSIGGKKAFWMNAELIFPVTKDFNIVGLVFYDGGAGWDTPNVSPAIQEHIRNNQFRFRQTVGVGLKIKSPTPISVAVGLKLDRNRRADEPVSEIHFSSAVDF